MTKNKPVVLTDEAREFFRVNGATGGYVAAANMTKQARHQRAKKAAAARVAKLKREQAQ